MDANTYLSFMEAYLAVYENAHIKKANKAMKKAHGYEYVKRRDGGNHALYDLKNKDGDTINLNKKGDDPETPAMTVSKDPKKQKNWIPINAKDHMKKLKKMDDLIKSVRES